MPGPCQPPTQNTAGGWLPGWYQITETTAPPGYWLDPSTAVQTVYLEPGATNAASVTFADYFLGSLSLTKSGNDTSLLGRRGRPVHRHRPRPLHRNRWDAHRRRQRATNTLTGLVPGQYHLVETTVPAGYTAVTPFDVQVAKGHATTTTSAADADPARHHHPVKDRCRHRHFAARGHLRRPLRQREQRHLQRGPRDVHDERVGDVLSSGQRRDRVPAGKL